MINIYHFATSLHWLHYIWSDYITLHYIVDIVDIVDKSISR